MGLIAKLSLFMTELPDSTFHFKDVAATSEFQTLCENSSLNFWSKNGQSELGTQKSLRESTGPEVLEKLVHSTCFGAN